MHVSVQGYIFMLLAGATLLTFSFAEEESGVKNEDDAVKFFLLTRENSEEYQVLNVNDREKLKNSNFNKSSCTVVMIHGFTENINKPEILLILNAFVNHTDCNVIGVDWEEMAAAKPTFALGYKKAIHNIRVVGKCTAELIDFLVSEGCPLENFHVVGFSLGAHAAGFTAKYLRSGTLKWITGLDPAGPGFKTAGDDARLDPSDAEYVETVNTGGERLGIFDPLGHVNYYPNGGRKQPGCSGVMVFICYHQRALEVYAASLESEIWAVQCAKEVFSKEECTSKKRCRIGQRCTKIKQGNFFLETNEQSPFAKKSDI